RIVRDDDQGAPVLVVVFLSEVTPSAASAAQHSGTAAAVPARARPLAARGGVPCCTPGTRARTAPRPRTSEPLVRGALTRGSADHYRLVPPTGPLCARGELNPHALSGTRT